MPAIKQEISNAVSGIRTRAFLSDDSDDVVLNVTTTINDSDFVDVTRHAIEDGADVTDHVASRPGKFTFEAILTDDDFDALNPTSFFNKTIEERFEIISGWIDNKTVLTYYGHETDIENVVIESISRRRQLNTGSGVTVSITLSKITIAESVETDVNVQSTQPKGKTATKSQTTQSNANSPASTAGGASKSWAKSLF
jgi:hypothetical protein